jgi:MATE family multidrug resistance protein
VSGIAAATATADYAGLLLGLAVTLQSKVFSPSHRNHELSERMRWHDILHGPSLRHLFALNRDLLLRTLSLVAAYAWFTRSGARAGDAILAANAVLLNLHNLASYALDGFANATEALVGESIGAHRLPDYRAVLRASTVAAAVVALLMSLSYFVFGGELIRLFTNQEPIRILAERYLPWAIAMPSIAIWGFQLDGIFIGATHARDLRNSMMISFLGFLLLAVALEHWFSNHGLWCALALFMVLRAITLSMRLPGIVKSFAVPTANAAIA